MTRTKSQRGRIQLNNVLTALIFVGFIFGFLIASFVIGDREFSDMENRNLASFPKVSGEAILSGQFTEGFETYVQDQFPARDSLMSLQTDLQKAAGKKDNGMVYFGKDGYLFSIETINEEQLAKNVDYINTIAEKLGPGVLCQLMVVPTATEILKDKLPSYAVTPDENKALDYVRDHTKLAYTDLRKTLEQFASQDIFYRTDHHWTTLGAMYAYDAWKWESKRTRDYAVTLVSDQFYGTNYSKASLSSIQPDCIYRYDVPVDTDVHTMEIYEADGHKSKQFDSVYDESYLQVKDKYSYFLSGNNPVTKIRGSSSPEAAGKKIMVIKDSFAHCFIPFMVTDYEEIIAVDLRYYRADLSALAQENGITEVLFLYNVLNLAQDKNLIFAAK